MGDKLAITWSSGRVAYVCGGCTSDNSLYIAILDGATLSPLSDVVEIPPLDANGLRRPQLAYRLVGGSGERRFALLADRDFHAYSLPGMAMVTCGSP